MERSGLGKVVQAELQQSLGRTGHGPQDFEEGSLVVANNYETLLASQ
jgi:hypothetical protein